MPAFRLGRAWLPHIMRFTRRRLTIKQILLCANSFFAALFFRLPAFAAGRLKS